MPPDTQEGTGEAGEDESATDPAPDPTEDAPGTEKGHPESPTKGLLTPA